MDQSQPPVARVARSYFANKVGEADYREREWTFPRGDCVLLPLENTTAEMLARYIAERLRDDLQEQAQLRPAVAARGG